MYDLMVFIDKNCDSLDDPRARNKVFLSYSDEFDPSFAKPLLQDYIRRLSNQANEALEETEKMLLQKKIDYLIKLLVWLADLRLIDLFDRLGPTMRQNGVEGSEFRPQHMFPSPAVL